MRPLRSLLICLLLSITTSTLTAETLERGPFSVDFQPQDRQVAEDTLGYLEAAQAEYGDRLPLGADPIQITIAGSMNEFLGLSGPYAHVGVSGVTRADRNLIALKSPRLRPSGDDYRGTVRHELIHVLLHRNTNTQNLPRWLNEGTCMMLANELRWGSSIQVAKMHVSGGMIPLDQLDRAFAEPGSNHQFGNAYAQALSMTRHLRKIIGDEQFWSLIRGMRKDSFAAAMNNHALMSPQAFWQSYEGSLWGLSLLSMARTGSFWAAVSLLCVLAYVARKWRDRAIVQRWAAEELEDDGDSPFDWNSILLDADDWKR